MPDRINTLVGASIRDRRQALGLSQAALAEALKLSRPSVTNMENGSQPLSIANLYAAAAVLGVHARDLLPDAEPIADRKGRHAPGVAALLSRLTSDMGTVA